MPDFKEIAKGGWHPKGKDGKSESWRGDFKGINQVSGWLGKGKDSTTPAGNRTSRPLSSLKDPSSFGPPPKHINYHGAAAVPNQTTPGAASLGQPLSQEEIGGLSQPNPAAEETKPKPPPIPFRVDTTGLSTSHLPPPPRRKDGADGRDPAPPAPPALKPKPPVLPPRLSTKPSAASPEPHAHKGILNQGSLNRLGAAGISVPGFDIGGAQSPISTAQSQPPTNNSAQLNELQSQFSRLSSSTSAGRGSPSEGTTFAQKQAALKTASSFRNNPSSVSLNDARSAAGTINNLRERHGDQIASGWQSANKLNNKYGVSDSDRSPRDTGASQPPEAANIGIQMRDNTQGEQTSALGKKKPPPPPAKKVGLVPQAPFGGTPPPIPLASKPKLQVSHLS